MFGLENAPNIVIVTTSAFSGRQVDLLESAGLRSMTYQQAEGLCIPRVVVGLSQLTFIRPVPHGYGRVLDEFNDWLLGRFPAGTGGRPGPMPTTANNGRRYPTFTIIQVRVIRMMR